MAVIWQRFLYQLMKVIVVILMNNEKKKVYVKEMNLWLWVSQPACMRFHIHALLKLQFEIV